VPTDKPIRGDEPYPIPYRDPLTVEKIVGKIRKAVQIGTAFFDWPLWRAYSTWDQYNEQLAVERAAAEKAGRAPHPSVAPPPPSRDAMQTMESEYRRLKYGPSSAYREPRPHPWVKVPKE
jgi:hypothetical protein